jgi:methanol metabolism-related c-type cytochrome
MIFPRRWLALSLAAGVAVLGAGIAFDSEAQQSNGTATGQTSDDQSKSNTASSNGEKPYKIEKDGTVDWATYNGYRRFNAYCETCHGFDGEGSSFGPRLVDSLKTMPYEKFVEIVTNGKQDVNAAQNLKMPAFGTNPNVICYIDDIYAYLKARADGVLGRGRPEKHAPKPQSAIDAENACMG